MAARRLMIVLMALIAVSMAITVIAQPLRNRFGPPGSTSTTTSSSTSSEPAPSATVAKKPGNPVTPDPQVTATLRPNSARTIRIAVGDQLTLFVKVLSPREITIPALGLSAYADPYAPARFDLLARESGRFAVRSASGRTLGVIQVLAKR